jgi:putative integral membrane protein (TIGR02587 family)
MVPACRVLEELWWGMQQSVSTKAAAHEGHHNRARSSDRSIGRSLQEYGRGVAGGLLFSLPFLYTMEVWWTGHTMPPHQLVLGLVVTFVLLLGYNRYAGLRRDASFSEVAIDSVEELGIGLFIAAVVLALLGQVTLDMPLNEIVGKIVVEAMTVAIGVSVGTAQLGSNGGGAPSDEQAGGLEGDDEETNLMGQLALAFCGAVLIAGNIAPTEEIIMLAVEASAARLIGLALLSLGLAAVILFYSDFRSAQRFSPSDGVLATIAGSVMTYAVALCASAFILWFFGSFDGFGPATWLAETVVLAVGAALGASAGRLLLQTQSGS